MSKKLHQHLHNSITVAEINHISENLDALHAGSHWIKSYLARPHQELGRTGSVCPFAQPALDQDTLRLAVVRLSGSNKRTQIIDAVNFHLKAFVSRSASLAQRVLHATVILFPDVSMTEAPDLIDGVKEEMKGGFIEQGLMLGEFHALNDSPGLHNEAFKPLRSPIPMLAIRHMVWSDVVFLNRSEYSIETRLKYLEAFLAVPNVPESSRREVERMVAALRSEAPKQENASLTAAEKPVARCPYSSRSN